MNYTDLKELIRYLKEITKCPQCNKKFVDKNIAVIATFPTEGVFQMDCDRCRHSIIVNAGLKSPNDKTTAVNKNDVQNMQSFLSKFNGDFKKLFQSSK